MSGCGWPTARLSARSRPAARGERSFSEPGVLLDYAFEPGGHLIQALADDAETFNRWTLSIHGQMLRREASTSAGSILSPSDPAVHGDQGPGDRSRLV
jgi:hypothetical protein